MLKSRKKFRIDKLDDLLSQSWCPGPDDIPIFPSLHTLIRITWDKSSGIDCNKVTRTNRNISVAAVVNTNTASRLSVPLYPCQENRSDCVLVWSYDWFIF